MNFKGMIMKGTRRAALRRLKKALQVRRHSISNSNYARSWNGSDESTVLATLHVKIIQHVKVQDCALFQKLSKIYFLHNIEVRQKSSIILTEVKKH